MEGRRQGGEPPASRGRGARLPGLEGEASGSQPPRRPDDGPARPLPGGKGWLRLVKPRVDAPVQTPPAGKAVPERQRTLFDLLEEKQREAEQLSLWPEGEK